MSEAKIFFTKSFERDIKLEGEVYKIVQNEDEQLLCVYDQHNCIYKMIGKESAVIYDDSNFKLITRILHQAHIDRYAIRK